MMSAEANGFETRLKEIFADALALENSAERARYLSQACGTDTDLRAEVESLLEAEVAAGDFLNQTILGDPSDRIAEGPGSRIGPYKLLEKIGEGGFGAVYVAEQDKPLQRRVALKIVKLGMDTRQVVARFEAERQALARMDHPNIAKVFDAGATESGRPYFVMELVRGIKITEYCDRHHLDPQQRLELFKDICHAVQHAHQKGIIHRDLKPSNILVAQHDTAAVPKVIDFGIAKATQGRLTDMTLYTGWTRMIGTPVYMAPEQAEFSGSDVDTRSDIYSLGVLLYELLTGRTPFEQRTVLEAGLDEIRRLIREVEPTRPSTRLGMLTEAELDTVARARNEPSPKLIGLVRGDLDCIVMKCLEKDRSRRYDTANGLALDIARHLGHEPILARPPSTWYRMEKGFRRNKLAFGAALAVFVALSMGIALSSWQAVRASREAERAEVLSRESQARLVRLYVDKGVHQVDAGDMAASLPWFAEAIEAEGSGGAQEEMHRLRFEAAWSQCPRILRIWFHDAAVTTVSFSPSGRFVVTTSDDATARVWDVRSGQPTCPALRHAGPVLMARFSPDDLLVATASQDGCAQIWNPQSGEPIGACLAHEGPVTSAEFSPDGRNLLTSSQDGTARIWEVGARLAGERILRHRGPVVAARYSTDGNRVVTACNGEENRGYYSQVWSADTGQPSSWAMAYSGPLTGVEFSSNGQWVLASSVDGTARIWLHADGLKFGCEPMQHIGPVLHATFSPDDSRLVTSTANGTAQVWMADTGQSVGLPLNHAGAVVRSQFCAQGRRIATCGTDRTACVWDAATGQQLIPRMRHSGPVTSVVFSPDGSLLATGSRDGTARLWDLSPFPVTGYGSVYDTVSGWQTVVSPDDKFMAIRLDSSTVSIVRQPQGEPVGKPLTHNVPVYGCIFSPDSSLALTLGEDQAARIWVVATGELLVHPLQHLALVQHAAFSSDGALVVTSTVNRKLRVWEVRTGAPLTPSMLVPLSVVRIRFTEAAKEIVVTSSTASEIARRLPTGAVTVEDLRLLSRLYSGMEIDLTGRGLEALAAGEIRNAWQAVSPGLLKLNELQRTAHTSSLWSQEGWFLPTVSDTATPRVSGIPPRSGAAGASQIDLTPHYNASLTESWHPGTTGNDLVSLPIGLHSFHGVPFDVRGLIQLDGQSLKAAGGIFPNSVLGIRLGQRCRRLHFLHATGWSIYRGTEIGYYVLRYADGHQRVLPIRYGIDLCDWWCNHFSKEGQGQKMCEATEARIEWTGMNQATEEQGMLLHLYVRSWDNPAPDIPITSLDFVSTMTTCAPFLVAVTVE